MVFARGSLETIISFTLAENLPCAKIQVSSISRELESQVQEPNGGGDLGYSIGSYAIKLV